MGILAAVYSDYCDFCSKKSDYSKVSVRKKTVIFYAVFEKQIGLTVPRLVGITAESLKYVKIQFKIALCNLTCVLSLTDM